MDFSFGIFLTTFGMVLLMEMGDKTQLLVMACASKYKPRQVIIGILISIAILNLLAVSLGVVLGRIKTIQDSVKAAASLLFIFFGLLSLRQEKEDESCPTKGSGAAIVAVAVGFFLAELGDKTQLSTFSFAALYPKDPASVFLGSTLALFAADCIGLVAGAVALKFIPKKVMALVSAFLFIAFGLISGYSTLMEDFDVPQETTLLITCATAAAALVSAAVILVRQARGAENR